MKGKRGKGKRVGGSALGGSAERLRRRPYADHADPFPLLRRNLLCDLEFAVFDGDD